MFQRVTAFTTRPELRGTFGMVASTHWLASAAGMAVLERGGNAFDAAVAAGFTLQVVEPHLNGPGGDLPAVFWSAERGEPLVLCAQGVAPAAATIERFRELGLELVPGTGLLAAVRARRVRRLAAAAARVRHLAARGRARVRDRLRRATAIPVVAAASPRRSSASSRCCASGPPRRRCTSRAASPGAASATRSSRRRTARIARRVARRLARGRRSSAPAARLLRGLRRRARSTASARATAGCSPATTSPRGARRSRSRRPTTTAGSTVCKTGPWGQGPVLPAAARAARRLRPRGHGPDAELRPHRHRVREARVRRPRGVLRRRAPTCRSSRLLSRGVRRRAAHARRRRRRRASCGPARRPAAARSDAAGDTVALGVGEPTRGDTVHLDVADRFGNLVSATPSGGWLQSSPVIPALGLPLGTRAQMFWLEEGLPSSLAPRHAAAHDAVARPRAARRRAVAGVRHAGRRPAGPVGAARLPAPRRTSAMNLQAAIDAPEFHTDHFPSSFYPARRAAALARASRSASART